MFKPSKESKRFRHLQKRFTCKAPTPGAKQELNTLVTFDVVQQKNKNHADERCFHENTQHDTSTGVCFNHLIIMVAESHWAHENILVYGESRRCGAGGRTAYAALQASHNRRNPSPGGEDEM